MAFQKFGIRPSPASSSIFALNDESGEEIIEQARSRGESLNRDTPIVVISGYLDRDLVLNIAGKVQGALVKPFETSSLLEIVRKFAKMA